MSLAVVEWFVTLSVIYAAVGFGFAVPFCVRGVNRIDPVAKAGTWGFRLLILPASCVFWPWLLYRWIKGAGPTVENTAHRRRRMGNKA